ncbi:hypothetical protein PBY51_024837 [Eleginops maclovinus]|uniref:Uncharacterized protein n=2 Tax=Eleginops maclovinus TaxID=56733 RepID=A0AAN7Y280_ELEMC|nr:hypothetical protein PBY51_024837 [Eleginops maclovinus]
MNWTQARQWCQTTYTDMVVIQNQRENNYLVSLLPNRNGSPYYWIGITKNHRNQPWTWIGNNSTWVGEHSWAANEPNNNHSTEFCVELYVNTGPNRGRWNDEKCSSLKFPVCYKAQCIETSCERGRCQETINNMTCICEPGFEGDRCQTAVRCPRLPRPDNGYLSCFGGNLTFNSTCRFECNRGFQIKGSSEVTCEDTGVWSGPRPTCASVRCPPLPRPDNGYLSCFGGNLTFNSTCRFECNRGFQIIGSSEVTCEDTGVWSGLRPTCASVRCPPLPRPDNGYLSCFGGNLTFNSTCRFQCNRGFQIIGSSEVTCEDTGVWSGPRPTCAYYKQALLAVAGSAALSVLCCICFCWMKHRKRKKLAQQRPPEEVTIHED